MQAAVIGQVAGAGPAGALDILISCQQAAVATGYDTQQTMHFVVHEVAGIAAVGEV